MAQKAPKTKRPEFVNGIRVRMPDNYDFNTFGISNLIQVKIGQSMIKITD
jgi:hypothetical protein